jgi:hypothetical protein
MQEVGRRLNSLLVLVIGILLLILFQRLRHAIALTTMP